MSETGDLLTMPEVAAILAVSYKVVLRTLERGYFTRDIRAGKYRLIRRSDLDEFRAAIKAGYLTT